MKLRVNGDEHDLPDETDLLAVLLQLGFPRDAVAVAVDGVVIPRRIHAGHRLREGQSVEVIRAVGGG